MIKAYGVLWGQCSLGVQSKLESRRDWQAIKSTMDTIDLLKEIKQISQEYHDTKCPIDSILDSLMAVINIKQREGESLPAYTQRFKGVVEHMEGQHGKLTLPNYITKMDGYTITKNLNMNKKHKINY